MHPPPFLWKFQNSWRNLIKACADSFYVNGNILFHKFTGKKKFRAVASVNSTHQNILSRETKAVLNLYQTNDFEITSVNTDQEFVCIREGIRPMELNI